MKFENGEYQQEKTFPYPYDYHPRKTYRSESVFSVFTTTTVFLVIASMMMSKDTQSSPIQGGSKRSLTTYLFKKFAES